MLIKTRTWIDFKNCEIKFNNRSTGSSVKMIKITPQIEDKFRQEWIRQEIFDEISYQDWFFMADFHKV